MKELNKYQIAQQVFVDKLNLIDEQDFYPYLKE